MTTNYPIVNIASYKFIDINDLAETQVKLRRICLQQQILGTILLGTEGVNLMLAGEKDKIDNFINYLRDDPRFSDMHFKKSFSKDIPFNRLVVKLKNEIIRMDHPEVEPSKHTAEHLPPETLKNWLDDNKDIVVLDTRNQYEIEVGTFNNAVALDIEDFRAFPDACKTLPESYKEKPVVTFCTGGIRCEKAAEYLVQQGYKNVYQLDGGILNYFEQCQGEHWDGECFVFDNRVSLDKQLNETNNFKDLLGKSKQS